MFVLVRQMVSRHSDDDADGLTVSSSVSGTPQSAAAVASPPGVGVPGSPGSWAFTVDLKLNWRLFIVMMPR